MKEIQRNVTKQSRRNPVSRFVRARNDKERITTWKSDLGRFLQVFTVRSRVPTWLSLTAPFQAELALNTRVAVSDMHHDMLEMRSDMLNIWGDGGQVRPVSANSIRFADNGRILTVAQVQTRSAASTTDDSATSQLHPACSESHLPRSRGPVSVVTK